MSEEKNSFDRQSFRDAFKKPFFIKNLSEYYEEVTIIFKKNYEDKKLNNGEIVSGTLEITCPNEKTAKAVRNVVQLYDESAYNKISYTKSYIVVVSAKIMVIKEIQYLILNNLDANTFTIIENILKQPKTQYDAKNPDKTKITLNLCNVKGNKLAIEVKDYNTNCNWTDKIFWYIDYDDIDKIIKPIKSVETKPNVQQKSDQKEEKHEEGTTKKFETLPVKDEDAAKEQISMGVLLKDDHDPNLEDGNVEGGSLIIKADSEEITKKLQEIFKSIAGMKCQNKTITIPIEMALHDNKHKILMNGMTETIYENMIRYILPSNGISLRMDECNYICPVNSNNNTGFKSWLSPIKFYINDKIENIPQQINEKNPNSFFNSSAQQTLNQNSQEKKENEENNNNDNDNDNASDSPEWEVVPNTKIDFNK